MNCDITADAIKIQPITNKIKDSSRGTNEQLFKKKHTILSKAAISTTRSTDGRYFFSWLLINAV